MSSPASAPNLDARIGEMVVYNANAPIPSPGEGMLNVLIKVSLGSQELTLSRSASIKDFKFTVPEALLPPSIVSTAKQSEVVVERAVQSNGELLPSWIVYDPETNTFTAKEVPAVAKPISIKIQTIGDGKVLEESPEIIIDTKQ